MLPQPNSLSLQAENQLTGQLILGTSLGVLCRYPVPSGNNILLLASKQRQMSLMMGDSGRETLEAAGLTQRTPWTLSSVLEPVRLPTRMREWGGWMAARYLDTVFLTGIWEENWYLQINLKPSQEMGETVGEFYMIWGEQNKRKVTSLSQM